MRATGRPSPSPLSSPAVAIGSLRSFLRSNANRPPGMKRNKNGEGGS